MGLIADSAAVQAGLTADNDEEGGIGIALTSRRQTFDEVLNSAPSPRATSAQFTSGPCQVPRLPVSLNGVKKQQNLTFNLGYLFGFNLGHCGSQAFDGNLGPLRLEGPNFSEVI